MSYKMSECDLSVFMHSNAYTGKPICLDIFSADGHVNFGWFNKLFSDSKNIDIIDHFIGLGVVKCEWCYLVKVKEIWEGEEGYTEPWVEIISVVEDMPPDFEE